MKTLLTIASFLCFSAFASAQEVQDRLQQMPPAVTQAQVERDAQLAAEHRKKNDEAKKAQQEALEKQKNQATAENTSKTRKTSSRPEKQ